MLRLSVTSRSSQHPQLGPNKKIKPTLNSQLRSYVNRGQGLSLSKCFVYPICIVRGTLLEPTGQPARRLSIYSFSQPAALSPTGPTSCSCQSQIIWHDILQASISNNQKHPTADPRYAPFPHVPAFEEPIGCYYGMIVIQHWMRQFDVGAEWCSLSHCGRGLEYRTQFQTHVSVIYRSVFHRRAVQGLRNACSVLPGLSACRLCLLFTSLWQTHTHTSTLMYVRMHTCRPSRHTHKYVPTHTWRQAALLHYTPPRLPDDYPASPIITRVSVSPLENLRSSAVKGKNAVNCTVVVVVVVAVMRMMMMTTPLMSHFSSFPNSSSQASSWPNTAAG